MLSVLCKDGVKCSDNIVLVMDKGKRDIDKMILIRKGGSTGTDLSQ